MTRHFGVACVLSATLLSGCNAPTPTRADAIDALQSRCVQDMLRQACRVMQPSGAAALSDPGGVVFVAGVGALPASAWLELRAAGDGMCRHVGDRCRAKWDSAPCRTARALYAAAAPQ